MARLPVAFVVMALVAGFASYGAQDYDFDWVTIGAAGNDPYLGESPFGPDYAYGRGSVGYEYRIGRTEVTTGQWLEFVNTFSTQSDDMKTFAEPFFWGAEADPTYDGPGRRYRLRGNVVSPELLPVGGISWREAARFCNWLHNDKSSALSAIEYGAYDASTWGDDGSRFTDDPAHLPGARFWIPTLDEALKAMNYDPDRYGEGQGGWWLYPNMSDEPPIPGVPGEGTTTAGLHLPSWGEWDIPLGAYSDQVSPWGLLDTTGGTVEWNEAILPPGDKRARGLLGAATGDDNYIVHDHVSAIQGLSPGYSGTSPGLRIATAIPAPGTWMLASVVCFSLRSRRRR